MVGSGNSVSTNNCLTFCFTCTFRRGVSLRNVAANCRA